MGQTREVHGILTVDGTATDATAAAVRQCLSGTDFFWLDLDGVDDETRDLLLHAVGVHQLVVDDVQTFGQRPKIEDYDTVTYMVVHGASEDGISVQEVHFILGEHFVITVRRGACRAMEEVRARISHHRVTPIESRQIALTYLIVDGLVDSFFPMLDQFDSQIDELEDAILVKPTEAQLGTLFTMKRSLIGVRKVITPQRDMFAGVTSGVIDLPGVTDEGQRYMRDIYDHLIRISDLVDGYRDLLSGVMDTHLSTVSNRLNVVMKQLTIIATVFLPLSFLTGFFGQNFSFLIAHITGRAAFYIFAVGLEVVSALGLLYLFRKRGWLGGPTD